MTEKEALVTLAAFVPFGSARIKLLRENFGSAQEVLKAKSKELRMVGLSEKLVNEFNKFRENFDADKYWKNLENLGVQPLTIDDKEYPRRLREIVDPPTVLYIKGTLLSQDEVSIAVVGSRKITSYGQAVAQKISTELASAGVTIISGLALGVDAIAHRAALEVSGRTLAVIGSGINNIYPSSHKQLADSVSRSGAVMSEYPLGYPAMPVNFPYRNRIVSGLSLGVVVIEGTEKSGTLLTAAHAAVQGRDVFAVPGPITSLNSAAPNLLIKQGAKLVTNVSDILEELDLKQKTQSIKQREVLPETEEEQKILSLLEKEELSADTILRSVDLDAGSVMAALTTMELKGLVKNSGGVYGKI